MAAAVWSAIDKSTLAEYKKGVSDLTKRGRWRLKRLEEEGRITYNHSGKNPDWAVEVGEHAVTARSRGQQRHFEALDPWLRLETNWGHFEATDIIAREDELVNRGDPVLIKHVSTIGARLSKSMRKRFCRFLYTNGNAAAYSDYIHGLLTMVSAGSFTAASDVVVKPGTGSYGGKVVTLGSSGGSWSSDMDTSPNATLANDWPDGQGDPEYEYNACKLIPVNSANWPTDGATDAESNLIPAIRRANIWLARGGDQGDAPDMVTLGSAWFNAFKTGHDPKIQLWAPHKKATELGFKDVLTFEGLDIQTEYDCPSEVGWMENIAHQELMSMNDDLFDVEAPWIDHDSRSKKFAVNFDGQMTYEPMFFGYLYNATEA